MLPLRLRLTALTALAVILPVALMLPPVTRPVALMLPIVVKPAVLMLPVTLASLMMLPTKLVVPTTARLAVTLALPVIKFA